MVGLVGLGGLGGLGGGQGPGRRYNGSSFSPWPAITVDFIGRSRLFFLFPQRRCESANARDQSLVFINSVSRSREESDVLSSSSSSSSSSLAYFFGLVGETELERDFKQCRFQSEIFYNM
jgi:hypothetical protein